jgi:hypothetical protein
MTDGGWIMKRVMLRYFAIAGLSALTFAGCNEYRVETVVREDGGGTRKMTFAMDPDQEDMAGLGEDGYAAMFGIRPGAGWVLQSVEEAGEDSKKIGKRTYAFERSIKGVAGWSGLDGSISVSGTVGKSDYSGTFFSNAVSLETGRTPGGGSYTYRESFRWTGLIETVVDFQADAYARRMKKDFPYLGEAAIAELRGMMAGHLLVGVRFLDIWNDGDEDLDGVAASAGKAAEGIVRKAGEKVAVDHVYEVARIYVADEDSTLEEFLGKNLPGVMYAGVTEVKIRLVMPGKVVDTNGRVMGDGSVEWKMNLLDAIGREIGFFARSEKQ